MTRFSFAASLAALLALAALVPSPAPAQTSPTPVDTWQKMPNGLMARLFNGAAVDVTVFGPGIVHIVVQPKQGPTAISATTQQFFPTTPPLPAVIAKPGSTPWHLAVTPQYVAAVTSELQARVSRSTGAVSFTDVHGQPLLAEEAGGRMINDVPLRTTAGVGAGPDFAVQQTFAVSPTEDFYGLGQHQQGLMSYRGSSVTLQQQNREVAVPFLVSSKGYGVLWNNPSVTRVDMGADAAQTIPSSALSDADGKPGGLTAQYYTGENFDTLVATKTDPQVNFLWTQTPPPGLPHDQYSVRWTGFVTAPRTGDFTLSTTEDDGARLWLDGKQVVDDWQILAARTDSATVHWTAGSRHSIRLDYFQDYRDAVIRLAWALPSARSSVRWSSEAGQGTDYFFCAGPSLSKVIREERQLTGQAPMPPKWALGYWQSKEHYATQQELMDVAARYRHDAIPLDVVVQDWFYWNPHPWGSHQFDLTRYPDMAATMQTLHNENVHLMISVWGKFDPGSANYDELMKAGALYSQDIGGGTRYYDPFNPVARKLYWAQISRELFSLGIDGWWLDASEAELSGNWGEFRGYQTASGPGAVVYNEWPLQHTSAVHDGQRSTPSEAGVGQTSTPSNSPETGEGQTSQPTAPGPPSPLLPASGRWRAKGEPEGFLRRRGSGASQKRVVILTRSAYAGQQRNGAITWSGDITGTWDVFKAEIPAGLNFCLSGIPYWTTDIGGFFVNYSGGSSNPDYAELFTRWYQYGAFCPIFRVHGTSTPKELWRFGPNYEPILIQYDNLRYRLMPYIYSQSWDITHNGGTLMRALVMDFPSDVPARESRDEFMFGPSLLVCPVTQAGATTRAVYLPAGTSWVDFWTGKHYAGGQTLTAAAPLQTMPLYVRAGTLLPFGLPIQYATEPTDAPTDLRIYPGHDADFTLYDDAGDGYGYEQGQYATIHLHWNDQAKTLTFGPRQGSYPGMPTHRLFRVVIVAPGKGVSLTAGTGKVMTYDGTVVTWRG